MGSLLLSIFLIVFIYCIWLIKVQRGLKIHHKTLLNSLQKRVDSLLQTNSTLGKDTVRIQKLEQALQDVNTSLQAEILQAKAIEEHLRSLIGHDSLTRLPNRPLFLDRLDQALTRVPWHNRHLGVFYLNIDHFKGVNDMLGYNIGDLLLKSVADRLSLVLRPGDTIGRMEGDSFALLCVDVAKGPDITKIAQTVLMGMSQPFVIENHEVYTTVSMGISISPEDGENAETLLSHAETALVRAKETGRNNWQYYSKEVNQTMLFRVQMENSLRHAIERNELKLYYQPKLDLISNSVVGFEALVRWQHSRLGLVHPKEFIPLAEEIGLIVPIGEWVIETACMQCKEWQGKGAPNLSMAVNLSARQFQRENIPDRVRQALTRSGLNPRFLELELTESLMQYSEASVGFLAELNAMGVLIGIDDFGVGFSSLSYLKELPISFIKIDQSFISGIPTDASDMAITAAIIQLGHSLHLTVIAEGVEEAEQMDFLRKLHCDLIQGYLIGKPNPKETVIEYIHEKKFYVG
jgi:diguanylate cyclase (GGDEF)-like protein